MSSATEQIRFSIEQVTPAKAERYLQKNTRNRQVSAQTVTNYAAAMKAGEWVINGETLKFDTAGHLLDGQHRLAAVIKAGMPVPFCVVHGLPRDVFKTLDGGRLRSNADCLYILGYKNPNALAAACRMLTVYRSASWPSCVNKARRVTNDQMILTLENHIGIVAASEAYMQRPLFTNLIPHSAGILTYYLAGLITPTTAKLFFTQLANGDYQSDNATFPIRVLRERLIETSLEILKPTTAVKIAWVIMAWNAYRGGHRLNRLPRIVEKTPRYSPEPRFPKRTEAA